MALGFALRGPTVGLDIGSSGVKAVALQKSLTGWMLVAAGESALCVEGPADDGAPVEIAGAVRELLSALKLSRARVAAALSGHSVIVKRLSMPSMSKAELAQAIPWEAEQYIPFELSDVQLDYQVVGPSSDPVKSTLDVLLVAARKDRIDDRAAVIAQAGLETVVLDVEAFALANAYEFNYPERADALAAIVHIGRSATIVCLLEKGQLAFTRDILLGGKMFAESLGRELGVGALTAERIQLGQLPSGISRDQASAILRDTSSQIILEIRKTIDFYRATAPIEKLSHIVVSGGACEAEGFVDQLQSELGAPVEVFDPFRRIARTKGAAGSHAAGPAYAVAVGLAMRKGGDR